MELPATLPNATNATTAAQPQHDVYYNRTWAAPRPGDFSSVTPDAFESDYSQLPCEFHDWVRPAFDYVNTIADFVALYSVYISLIVFIVLFIEVSMVSNSSIDPASALSAHT